MNENHLNITNYYEEINFKAGQMLKEQKTIGDATLVILPPLKK